MRRDDELPLVLEGISTMRGYALFGAAWLASSSRTPPSYGQPPTAYGAAQTSGHNSLTWHHVPYKMQYPHTSNASSGFANQTATNEPPSYGTSIRQTSNPSSNTTFYPTSSRPASISPIVPTNFTVLPVPTPSGPISANTTKTGSLNCASCLFGAATATLHRFPYTFVATLTVTIAPQVIIHPNGSREATTITRSPTQLSSFQSAASTLRTFTDDREKTWSTLGVTMSFPTTYIQYASFERAQLRNASGRIANCSGAYSTAALSLPSAVEPASLIYPWQPAGAMFTVTNMSKLPGPLPTALVSYLDRIGSNGSYTALKGVAKCSPLRPTAIVKPAPRPPRGTSTSTCYTLTSTLMPSWNRTSPSGAIIWRNTTQSLIFATVCTTTTGSVMPTFITNSASATSTNLGVGGTDPAIPALTITTETLSTETTSLAPTRPEPVLGPTPNTRRASSSIGPPASSITLTATISTRSTQIVLPPRTTSSSRSCGFSDSPSISSATTTATAEIPPPLPVSQPSTTRGGTSLDDTTTRTSTSQVTLTTTAVNQPPEPITQTSASSATIPATISTSPADLSSSSGLSIPVSTASSLTATAPAADPPLEASTQTPTSLATISTAIGPSTSASSSFPGATVTACPPLGGPVTPPSGESVVLTPSSGQSSPSLRLPLSPTSSQASSATNIVASTSTPGNSGGSSNPSMTEQMDVPSASISASSTMDILDPAVSSASTSSNIMDNSSPAPMLPENIPSSGIPPPSPDSSTTLPVTAFIGTETGSISSMTTTPNAVGSITSALSRPGLPSDGTISPADGTTTLSSAVPIESPTSSPAQIAPPSSSRATTDSMGASPLPSSIPSSSSFDAGQSSTSALTASQSIEATLPPLPSDTRTEVPAPGGQSSTLSTYEVGSSMTGTDLTSAASESSRLAIRPTTVTTSTSSSGALYSSGAGLTPRHNLMVCISAAALVVWLA